MTHECTARPNEHYALVVTDVTGTSSMMLPTLLVYIFMTREDHWQHSYPVSAASLSLNAAECRKGTDPDVYEHGQVSNTQATHETQCARHCPGVVCGVWSDLHAVLVTGLADVHRRDDPGDGQPHTVVCQALARAGSISRDMSSGE